MSNLPRNWEELRLGDHIEISYGKGLLKAQRESIGNIPVYGSNGIIGHHTSAITEAPAIIIGRKGSVGAAHFSSTKCWPIDTTFYIDHFPPGFDAKFLGFFLQSRNLADLNIHAAIPGIRRDDLYDLMIPVPCPDELEQSLAEQRRIVARIEALLAEVREMRKLQAAITADTDAYLSATLAEIFPALDQPMPEGWVLKKVKDIAEKPQYGLTQAAKREPIGPKFLRITDIQNGGVNWNDVPYCQCDYRCLEKYQLKEGDIVFARSGATTGKTYLVINPPEEAVFASYLIRLVLREQLPEFVYWFFQSPSYWRQISPIGAAIPNMNATLLQEVKIPLPLDEREQLRIIAYLDVIKAEIDEMRLLNKADERYIGQLEQAILAQAFRGEL